MDIFPTSHYVPIMTQSTENDGSALEAAVRRLLRPLVKALIAKGITAPALYSMLKQVYVETAREEFRLSEKPLTDSRVSVLTGVHRKDVRALREQSEPSVVALDRRVTVMTTVVGRWLADPLTTDEAGKPLELPRQAVSGPSFDSLVESVSRDIRPRTVLDELLRLGVVDLNEPDQTISLRSDALLTREAGDERFHFFSRNISDHLAAAAENILTEGDQAPFLERAVFYNNLKAGSVDEIEARARALAGEALSDLNRLGYARQNEDAEEEGAVDDASHRFRFGVYFYREDEAAFEDLSDDESPEDKD